MSMDTELALADLGAAQWGLFTAYQAQSVGVNRMQITRLARAGIVHRLAHGVYVLRAVGAVEHQELRAAWLAVEPARLAYERIEDGADGVVVSHASAANLYGFGDLNADRHEFLSKHRKQTRRPDIRFHRTADLDNADVVLRDGLPTVRVERVIVDLLAERHDGEHVAGVLADAVRARAIDLDEIPARLKSFASQFGCDSDDGQGVLEHLLELGSVSELVAAEQIASVARAGRPDLARLAATSLLISQPKFDRLAVSRAIAAVGDLSKFDQSAVSKAIAAVGDLSRFDQSAVSKAMASVDFSKFDQSAVSKALATSIDFSKFDQSAVSNALATSIDFSKYRDDVRLAPSDGEPQRRHRANDDHGPGSWNFDSERLDSEDPDSESQNSQ